MMVMINDNNAAPDDDDVPPLSVVRLQEWSMFFSLQL